MFENYRGTKEDFKAIEEGIRIVWDKKLDFIFRRRSDIKNVGLLSFDSNFFYLWVPFKFSRLTPEFCGFRNYWFYRVSHKLKIDDYDQMGWWANADKWINFLPKFLLNNKKIILISGGLLTPFIKIHGKYLKEGYTDIYVSKESYLATIVHEFAHIYYNSQPPEIFIQNTNLKYLKTAFSLYKKGRREKLPKIKIHSGFAFELWTELFAFCAEYSASSTFWPSFRRNLDFYAQTTLKKLIKTPSFLNSRDPHTTSLVLGKILITKYPTTWPVRIFQF